MLDLNNIDFSKLYENHKAVVFVSATTLMATATMIALFLIYDWITLRRENRFKHLNWCERNWEDL